MTSLSEIELVLFDFDGVFTDNRVLVMQDGKEAVMCSRADGLGLSLLRKKNIPMAIVSTETNPVVQERAKKLKLECHSACEDKLQKARELADKYKTTLARTAFVGNDINDTAVLREVGLPVVVADADLQVKEFAKIILKRPGGFGAVREFCEMVDRGEAI